MKGFPDLPPIWWGASIALIYAIKQVSPDLHFSVDGAQIVSRILLIVALAIVAWSAVWFWRKRTPIEPNHTPKSLIVEGPYRMSRNPIYLALVLLTVSSAIGNGSPVGVFIAVLLWWVLDKRFARKEEQGLQDAFGAEATEYLKNTRRWI